MRCPDCNKFVSYDEPECEVGSVEINAESVSASVTVNLNCAECGSNLKDAEIESDADFTHECSASGKPDEDYEKDGEQFEISDDGDPQGESRLEDKDRKGKQIKNSRYMKTFYGFTMETEVHCKKCGEDFSVNLSGEEQASAFNENC